MLPLHDICLSSASLDNLGSQWKEATTRYKEQCKVQCKVQSTMERGQFKVQTGSKQAFLLSRNNHFESWWDDMTNLNFMKH